MRYFIEVCYDGTAFRGSQLQGELPTVQLSVNQAMSTILREEILSFGASRTDSGVHAISAFYHFDYAALLDHNFIYKMNAILPDALSVKALYLCTDENANARFDAVQRKYRYKIYFKKDPFLKNRALFYPKPYNLEVLQQSAQILMEYNDFETFSKKNTQNKSFKCNLFQSSWQRNGLELHYTVTGNRFLRGMVRALVGTQLQVAQGKYTLQQFRNIIELKDCQLADFSVTGNGLYLEEIHYPDHYFEWKIEA